MSARACIALEIGTRWVKAARFDAGRTGPALRRVECEPHAGETPDLIERVVGLRGRLQASGLPCVSHLPRQIVNVRLLNLPSTDPAEIADMVDLQAGRQIPYSREEVHCEYVTLGSDASGYTRVMLVVVQRALVRHRFHVLEEAGCAVERMSVSTEGLLAWYLAGPGAGKAGGEADMLVDVDASHTDVLVIREGRLEFTRGLLTGADDVEAEGGARRLAEEIARSLEAYRAEPNAAAVRRIVLTGARLAAEAVPAPLAALVTCPVEPLAAEALFGPAAVEGLSPNVSITALVGTAAGADRPGLDIVPEALQLRRALLARARAFTATGMLAASVCFTAGLAGFLHVAFLTRRVDAFAAEAARLEMPAAEVQSMRKRTAVIQERLDSRTSPVSLLREMHLLIPDAAHLSSFECAEPARVTLSGVADTRNALREFITRLEASALFRDVKNPEARATRASDGTERVDFQIVCEIERQGREG